MRYFLPLLLPALALAGWTQFKSGPFEVVTEAGDKEARITLNYLEQLRNALGQAIGQQEMQSVWPIRVVVLKPKRQVFPELKFRAKVGLAASSRLRRKLPRALWMCFCNPGPGMCLRTFAEAW